MSTDPQSTDRYICERCFEPADALICGNCDRARQARHQSSAPDYLHITRDVAEGITNAT
jgi:hypothetical protein